jgi:hypothetical protein
MQQQLLPPPLPLPPLLLLLLLQLLLLLLLEWLQCLASLPLQVEAQLQLLLPTLLPPLLWPPSQRVPRAFSLPLASPTANLQPLASLPLLPLALPPPLPPLEHTFLEPLPRQPMRSCQGCTCPALLPLPLQQLLLQALGAPLSLHPCSCCPLPLPLPLLQRAPPPLPLLPPPPLLLLLLLLLLLQQLLPPTLFSPGTSFGPLPPSPPSPAARA